MNPTESSKHPPGETTSDAPEDHERREALRKLGGLAAWTAPVTVTLMVTPRRSAASFGGGLPPPPP